MSETLEQMIERHEGCRFTPYPDSLGILTIGIGHNLNKPLSRAAVEQIQRDDIKDARNDCLHAFPWFAELDEPRQKAVIDMCFNLGLSRLKQFTKFLSAMSMGEYEEAAKEMLNSRWAEQVKGRATELAAIIRRPTEI